MGRPRKIVSPQAVVPPKKIHGLEGSADLLTDQDALWEAVIKKVNQLARVYGFARADAPLLEDWHLYNACYRGQPRFMERLITVELSGKTAAVRPVLLPSLLRAYAEHKVFERMPLAKWFAHGATASMDPKTKALRQDMAFDFEVFGNFNHLTEAQVIGVVWELLQHLGLKESVLEINNIGTAECQAAYQGTLQDFLAGKKYGLCDSCNEHLSGRVLNVFRCDNLDCQAIVAEAPTILDFLDQESHKHFTNILEALDELGIPYQLNPLYAGPDGFGKTNFVIKYKIKDETVVIGEGGSNDGLMQAVCGKNFCSFGFSGSLSAVKYALEASKTTALHDHKSDVFLVPLGELASKKSLRLFRDLTAQRIAVYDHFGNIGVKNQLKQAEVYKAPIALIMGQKEALDEMVILRDVKSGMQEIISYDKIVEEVKKRLGK